VLTFPFGPPACGPGRLWSLRPNIFLCRHGIFFVIMPSLFCSLQDRVFGSPTAKSGLFPAACNLCRPSFCPVCAFLLFALFFFFLNFLVKFLRTRRCESIFYARHLSSAHFVRAPRPLWVRAFPSPSPPCSLLFFVCNLFVGLGNISFFPPLVLRRASAVFRVSHAKPPFATDACFFR